MKNNKAQALVEFVLLLPIILLLIFSFIDVINLALTKSNLNNKLNDQIELYEKNKITLNELEKNIKSKDIKLISKIENEYISLKVIQKVTWISPMTDLILKDYKINIKRVIPYE